MAKGQNRIRADFDRLDWLVKRTEGESPLSHRVDAALYERYCEFQRRARANWPDMIVRSRRERIRLSGFGTDAENDADGDSIAMAMAKRARLLAELPDAIEFALTTGRGPMIVGRTNGRTLVTAEDPREMAIFRDPADKSIRAGFKIKADPDMGWMRAYLYWTQNGTHYCHVARREIPVGSTVWPVFTEAWEWDPDFGGIDGQVLSTDVLPIVELKPRHGVGVFERHLDLLDKITFQTLSGLIIMSLQAAKQRAAIGLPDEDEDGNEYDWDGILQAGPGALWNLPEGVELVELSEANLSGLLEFQREARRELSDLTATPLRASVSDSANQTAEGAAYAREQLVFSIEDFIELANEPVATAQALIAQWEGDSSRSDPIGVIPKWMDPARRSLAEMGDVDSKAQKTLPLKERLVKIWQYSPAEAERIAAEKRAEDLEMQAMGLFDDLPDVDRPDLIDGSDPTTE